MINQTLQILGSLGIFLFGMRILSDAIQKVAGNKMQTVLNIMTHNRYIAVLSGLLITTLIQSSSATTVMVVSFSNAMLLTLQQAVGVIMGANIGTTVTTWLVSVFGFKFSIAKIAVPIIGLGFPFALSSKHKPRNIGQLVVGFGLLFLGLGLLKESVPDIKHHPELLEFLQNYTDYGFWSLLFFLGMGTVLTVIIQSSSAAMAITITIAFKGWIDYPSAAAIILGGNIGTTITANLASIGTNLNARRSARAHLLFNLFGVILMLFVFKPFSRLVLAIAPWNSTKLDNLPLNLSLFHTMFNIANTIVFLPFVGYFSKFVSLLVKSGKDELPTQYELKYISTGLQDTVEMHVFKASQEIRKMADITHEMLIRFVDIYFREGKSISEDVEKIKKQEDLTDEMQVEISKYLLNCMQEDLSDKTTARINAMIRILNELESVADAVYRLTLLAEKKYEKKMILHTSTDEEISSFSVQVLKFIVFYKEHLHLIESVSETDLDMALKLEKKIDQSRYKYKKAAQQRLQEGSDVKVEFLYIDMLRHFEHIGDYALNIIEALKTI
ncbi:MAG: Na/Pi cotransporter family protein [Candidatus Cloacimonetes bacterium]|nr:Na/Pi cotransporter family protein [Candidatus Cloacimonadota bacterium]